MAKNHLLRPWEHPALTGPLRLRLVPSACRGRRGGRACCSSWPVALGRPQVPRTEPTSSRSARFLTCVPRSSGSAREGRRGWRSGGSGYSFARRRAEVRSRWPTRPARGGRHAERCPRSLPFGARRSSSTAAAGAVPHGRAAPGQADVALAAGHESQAPGVEVDGSIALVGPNGPSPLRTAAAASLASPNGRSHRRDSTGRRSRPQARLAASLTLRRRGAAAPVHDRAGRDHRLPLCRYPFERRQISTIPDSCRSSSARRDAADIVTDTGAGQTPRLLQSAPRNATPNFTTTAQPPWRRPRTRLGGQRRRRLPGRLVGASRSKDINAGLRQDGATCRRCLEGDDRRQSFTSTGVSGEL